VLQWRHFYKTCAANAAANRHVTVFAIKWNTIASIYNTTLHKPQGADHEAKINIFKGSIFMLGGKAINL
jgi:hypothetical protein